MQTTKTSIRPGSANLFSKLLGWLEYRSTRILLMILAVSVAVRLILAFVLGATLQDLPGAADQISYHTLAIRVLGGHGFSFGEPWWPATRAGAPTAHWSYLYTFFVALLYKIFGPQPVSVRIFQALIVGVLHPYLAYRIGKEVFNKAAGLIGAGITGMYAYFIYYSALLMTEAFYITAVLGVLLSAMVLSNRLNAGAGNKQEQRRSGFVLGLCLAAAILLRQLFLVIVPFLFLWLWFTARKRGAARNLLLPLVLATLVVMAAILPFTISNMLRFHQFELLNSNAGFAFFWGNHPVHGDRFQPILTEASGTYGELLPPELEGLDEVSLDKELLSRGLGFVVQDPVRYIKLSISRIPAYFMFWPSPESSVPSNLMRAGSFGILLPFMLFGLVLDRLRFSGVKLWILSPGGILLVFIAAYTGIHLLSWALVRYRLPVDAALVLFAAYALTWILHRLSFRGMAATNPIEEKPRRSQAE